jgi:hypothetical protein
LWFAWSVVWQEPPCVLVQLHYRCHKPFGFVWQPFCVSVCFPPPFYSTPPNYMFPTIITTITTSLVRLRRAFIWWAEWVHLQQQQVHLHQGQSCFVHCCSTVYLPCSVTLQCACLAWSYNPALLPACCTQNCSFGGWYHTQTFGCGLSVNCGTRTDPPKRTPAVV